MGSGDRTSILVLSDLHAWEVQGERAQAPSALHMVGSDHEARRMFDGVVTALSAAGVTAVDAVMCPGDMTDRAEPGSLVQVWAMIAELAGKLGGRVFATAGNHDYASHPGYHSLDPKESLQELKPLFPSDSEDSQREYFAYSYAVEDHADLRVVMLNSSAYHGLSGGDGQAEYMHGRVTKATVGRLERAVSLGVRPAHNVLLTHHHPIQLPYFDTDERSQMIEGGLLLKALEDDGCWLIVHGHKHRPWIHYGHGGGGSATIFSAGSFAADLGGDSFGASLRNQFYLIELLSPDELNNLGLGLAGTVRAWSRSPYGGMAWVPAGPTDGMAAESGFGWRENPHTLAGRAIQWLKGQSGTVTKSDLAAWEPRLRYLVPDDFTKFAAIVGRASRYNFTFDNYGSILGIEIGPSA